MKQQLPPFIEKIWSEIKKINLREDSKRGLFINLGIIAALGFFAVFTFFYIYLPLTTHHGETITVPNLEGMQMAQVEEFLEDRDLRFIVADSGYNPKFPPLSVLEQDPPQNARVKVNRRIHLTINSVMPPMESVPNIIDNSLRQADLRLESYGFKRGTVKYVADKAANAVISIFYKGKPISKEDLAKGFMLPKGSRIDLEVGDGMGDTSFEMLNLAGKSYEEAELILRGIGLSIGSVVYEKDDSKPLGTVLRQRPAYTPGRMVKTGEVVDLWVSGIEIDENEETENN